MPYTINNPPDYIKGLPDGAQRIFIEVFNAEFAKSKDETKARMAGWGAVKTSYEKRGEEWVLKACELMRYASLVAAESVDASNESMVQIFRTGVFKHPVYGKFTVTDSDLDSMEANFAAHRPLSPTELVVDYEHMSAKGDQIAPAAGWVKGLVRKAGELFAKISWTQKAAGMIRAGEYRFISPEWQFNYRDKSSGKDIGPALLSIALTNRPFIEGMQPVSLSESMLLAEWDVAYINNLPDSSFGYVEPGEKDAEGKTVPRTNRHLPYRNADGSVSLDHLRNALARLDQTSISPEAKAQARRKLEAAANEAGVGSSGQDESNKAQEVNPLEKQIREMLGLAEGDDVIAAIKALKAKADSATQEVTAAKAAKEAAETSLKAKDTELKVANGKLMATEVQADVDQALKDGHILPKQVEWAKSMRARDPEGFKAFVASAPKLGPNGAILGKESVEDVTLTATEIAIAGRMGVSKDQLIAQKKADATKGK